MIYDILYLLNIILRLFFACFDDFLIDSIGKSIKDCLLLNILYQARIMNVLFFGQILET